MVGLLRAGVEVSGRAKRSEQSCVLVRIPWIRVSGVNCDVWMRANEQDKLRIMCAGWCEHARVPQRLYLVGRSKACLLARDGDADDGEITVSPFVQRCSRSDSESFRVLCGRCSTSSHPVQANKSWKNSRGTPVQAV